MTNSASGDIKVILLGESGVGKTNLINVTVGQDFNENEQTTFSSSFVQKIFTIGKKKYTVQLWDTIGQEKYRHLAKLFFKDSKIVVLVYDKTVKKSFDELAYWAEQIKQFLGNEIVIGVAGNKEDLDDTGDGVKEDEAKAFAEKIGAKFKLVSAKINGPGFVTFLQDLLEFLLKKTC